MWGRKEGEGSPHWFVGCALWFRVVWRVKSHRPSFPAGENVKARWRVSDVHAMPHRHGPDGEVLMCLFFNPLARGGRGKHQIMGPRPRFQAAGDAPLPPGASGAPFLLLRHFRRSTTASKHRGLLTCDAGTPRCPPTTESSGPETVALCKESLSEIVPGSDWRGCKTHRGRCRVARRE